MIVIILRLVGVLNAAVWFGSALFFTFGVAPTFFTPAMKALLGGGETADYYAGIIAQMVLERYFVLNHCCGIIALVHLVAEWMYLGKAMNRLTLGILTGAFCLGLIGGVYLQPKLKALHQIKYDQSSARTPAQKIAAGRSFGRWHGVSQVINLVVLIGLGVYMWKMAHAPDTSRYVISSKFRS